MSAEGRAVLAELRLSGLYRDATHACMHPVLGHALDQITEDAALTSFNRVIYEPFTAAQRARPGMTLREFLLDDPGAQRLAIQVLGEDQFTLATRTGGPEYFAARDRVLAALHDQNPPIRQWMAWGHWGHGTDPEIELFEGMPLVLPVDFPVQRDVRGVLRWTYPRWDTARKRFYQNLALAELYRRLDPGTVIGLDVLGAGLLPHLNFSRAADPIAFVGEAQLQMSTTQVVQLLSTGRSPAWKSAIDGLDELVPGMGSSIGRVTDDARWELFRRTGEPEFVDPFTFDEALGRNPVLATDRTVPPAHLTNPNHAVTRLSNADLVAIIQGRDDAPLIGYIVYELEHRRAQRAGRAVQGMLNAFGQAVDPSLVQHLCGLADPHNLRLVTPIEHGRLDMLAGNLGGGQRWVENPDRSANVGLRAALPDDLELIPMYPGQDSPRPPLLPRPPPSDAVPLTFRHDFDEHEDYARAMNVFFGFSPYQLEPVARMFQPIDVAGVLARLGDPEQRALQTDNWNHFAGTINAAINHYGMDRELLLHLIVDGRPL